MTMRTLIQVHIPTTYCIGSILPNFRTSIYFFLLWGEQGVLASGFKNKFLAWESMLLKKKNTTMLIILNTKHMGMVFYPPQNE